MIQDRKKDEHIFMPPTQRTLGSIFLILVSECKDAVSKNDLSVLEKDNIFKVKRICKKEIITGRVITEGSCVGLLQDS